LKYIRNITIVVLFILLINESVKAQIYNEGREAYNVRYEVLKAPSYRLIYPIKFHSEALKLSNFIDTIAPYVAHGIKSPYYSFPIILYTSDQYSNGMVSLLPSRADLFMVPSASMTSTPWTKQLTAHEYRHVAQISALKTGVLKGASYVLGDLGVGIGLVIIPKWILEGDATNAETQLTEYGRGLQPSFSIEYRAMMTDEAKKPFNKYYIDNLILGSYKNHIPDYYKFGYNMIRSYETHLSNTFSGELFQYAARNPYVISPTYFMTRKYGYKNVKKFAQMTFANLDSLWRPLSRCNNNYDYITKSERSYTVYQYPISIGDGRVIALKKSMDNSSHLVLIRGNKEQTIAFVGNLSSRPIYRNGVIYWTEYKSDYFYELKSSSVIRSVEIDTKYRNNYRKDVNSFLLTPTPDGWATIRYDSLLHASIILSDSSFIDRDTISFDLPASIHGLAYDNYSEKLYFIAVDDRGMWIGSAGLSSDHKIDVVRFPSAVTLSDLSASDGKLYFGSIQSGKDEIHMIDLAKGLEFQLSKSRLGARQPSPLGVDSVLMTGYSVEGWNIATISNHISDSTQQVSWQRLPNDILNPDYVKWYSSKAFDTIVPDTTLKQVKKVKRYHRSSDWFTFHSWTPGIAADFDDVLSDYNGRIGFGATGLFQSPLGDFQGYATLGVRDNKFWTVGKIDYSTLPVVFSLKGEYGGGVARLYIPTDKSYSVEKYGELGNAYDIVATMSLPMNFSSYAVLRNFTPMVNYIRTGDYIYDEETDSFVTGLDKWEASISYSSYKSYSMRCLSPRLGVSIKLGTQRTLQDNFSQIYYAKLSAYLPGLLKNHSMVITGSSQYQHLGDYGLFSKTYVPTGIIDNNIYQKYHYVAGTYKFPICYPDWGLDRYIFCKRLFTEIFAEYSHGAFPKEIDESNVNNVSYGFAIGIDVSTLTSSIQNVKFKIAFPNSQSTYVTFSYAIKI